MSRINTPSTSCFLTSLSTLLVELMKSVHSEPMRCFSVKSCWYWVFFFNYFSLPELRKKFHSSALYWDQGRNCNIKNKYSENWNRVLGSSFNDCIEWIFSPLFNRFLGMRLFLPPFNNGPALHLSSLLHHFLLMSFTVFIFL